MLSAADLSRDHFKFKLPDGNTKYKTCFGGVTTIILGLIIFTYSITQFIVFYERSLYSIIEKYEEKSLTPDF